MHAQSGGREVSGEGRKKLLVYLELLLRWQGRINLTGWTDSASLSSALASGLVLGDMIPPGKVVVTDVGTGNGITVFPASLVRPNAAWHLLEPRRKRYSFLREVVRAWGEGERIHPSLESDETCSPEARSAAGVISRAVWPAEVFLSRVLQWFPAAKWAITASSWEGHDVDGWRPSVPSGVRGTPGRKEGAVLWEKT